MRTLNVFHVVSIAIAFAIAFPAPSTANDEVAKPGESEFAEQIAARLKPLQQNGWLKWKPGTVVVTTFLPSDPDKFASFVQADLKFTIGGEKRGENNVDDRSARTDTASVKKAKDEVWCDVTSGDLLRVQVQPVLYERSGDPNFCVRIRLSNRSTKIIGVDLRDYRKVIYPNKWGFIPKRQRNVTKDRRIQPELIDKHRRASMLADFRDMKLTEIAPESSVEYFREFDASGRKDVEDQQREGKFFFLSMDGQLFVTDGDKVENINPSKNSDQTADKILSDVIVVSPISFKDVSRDVFIVKPVVGDELSRRFRDRYGPIDKPRASNWRPSGRNRDKVIVAVKAVDNEDPPLGKPKDWQWNEAELYVEGNGLHLLWVYFYSHRRVKVWRWIELDSETKVVQLSGWEQG